MRFLLNAFGLKSPIYMWCSVKTALDMDMRSSTAKLAFLIVAFTVITTGLLALRHERIRTAHHIMLEHQRINNARQGMWDMQVRIADHATPRALEAAIIRARIDLEPAVGVSGGGTLGR